MDSDLEELWENVAEKIKENTLRTLRSLHDIWITCYAKDTRQRYATKMVQHVEDLYNHILEEAHAKKRVMQTEIDVLKDEISRVCMLLSEEVPEYCKGIPDIYHNAVEVLNHKLLYLNDNLRTRENEITHLMNDANELCSELGIKAQVLNVSPLPTVAEIEKFKRYLAYLRTDRDSRKSNVEKMLTEIMQMLSELENSSSKEFELEVLNSPQFTLSDEHINRLKSLHVKVSEELSQAKCTTQDLRVRIQELWDSIGESPEAQHDFESKHCGYGNSTINALKKEIIRCEIKKRQNIEMIIDKRRTELCIWLEKCHISNEEKEKIVCENEDYSEETLNKIEQELQKIEEYYNSNREIFDLLSKRSTLWNKMIELDDFTYGKNRYNNRGGQLLKEEKERRKIVVQLPKLEEELNQLAIQHKNQKGIDFVVNGELVEDIIRKGWEEYKKGKHCKISMNRNSSPSWSHGLINQTTTEVDATTKITQSLSTLKPSRLTRPKTRIGSGHASSKNS